MKQIFNIEYELVDGICNGIYTQHHLTDYYLYYKIYFKFPQKSVYKDITFNDKVFAFIEISELIYKDIESLYTNFHSINLNENCLKQNKSTYIPNKIIKIECFNSKDELKFIIDFPIQKTDDKLLLHNLNEPSVIFPLLNRTDYYINNILVAQNENDFIKYKKLNINLK